MLSHVFAPRTAAFAVVAGLILAPAARGQSAPAATSTVNEFQRSLSFELNRGQADPQIKALTRGAGYGLLLTAKESIVVLSHGTKSQTVLRVAMLGSNQDSVVSGLDLLPGTVSYHVGNDPAKWRTGIPTYAKVKYSSVYPGVDLIYHGSQGALEYDFIVSPGASHEAIRFQISGARQVRLNDDGALALETDGGTVLHRKPVLYQDIDGARRVVDGRFRLQAGNQVSFEVGDYDRRHELVIDPSLGFYTYFGGTGTDQIKTVAVTSPSGLTFFGGVTTSTSLPAAANTYSGGSSEAFVSAYGSNATSALMTVFLGGSGTDAVTSLALDSAAVPSFLVVTGITNSPDFPTLSAAQPTPGGNYDAFLTKYNIALSGGVPSATLAFSTYLGGSGVELGNGIAASDTATGHHLFVTGLTTSTNFPTHNPLQAAKGGGSDIFLTKYSLAGVVEFSTYIGGAAAEQASSVAVFNQSLPTVEAIPFISATVTLSSTTSQGLALALNSSGSAVTYRRLIGAPTAATVATGIAVDDAGQAYVTGVTDDAAFPMVNPVQAAKGGGDDAFIMRLDSAGIPNFSTYYGGTGDDKAFSIAVDTFNGGGDNILIAGQTTGNFPATAVDTSFGGVIDGFVVLLNGGSAPSLNYATYIGGAGVDIIYSVCVGSGHNARVAGITNSPGLATSGAAQSSIAGGLDGFVARIDTN